MFQVGTLTFLRRFWGYDCKGWMNLRSFLFFTFFLLGQKGQIMSEELRKIKITSGRYEVEMEVTQEQYSSYMRPWWEMKQKAKRNRDAMEEKGYFAQSYEEWQTSSVSVCDIEESVEEKAIKREKLENLAEALKTLSELELEIAQKILTGDMTTTEFAKCKGLRRTTVSDKKKAVLVKLQKYFRKKGYEI